MTPREYILAVDCGTTSSKTVLIDLHGRILDATSRQRRTYFPQQGYVEQRLDELWRSVCEGCRALAPTRRKLKILGLSFSGTIGDAIALDRKLNPVTQRFMLYSDTRSLDQCRRLERMGGKRIYRATGNPISPASCLPKWMWIKEQSRGEYERTSRLIQPKDFLLLRATGKLCTDYVTASATMAFNIEARKWSESILSQAGIDRDKMPDPVESDTIVGELAPAAARQMGLPVGLPVVAGAGDTGAMMLGAGAVKSGNSILYLGGGAEVDLTTGKPIVDRYMRIPSRLHPITGRFFTSITALSAGTATEWFTHLTGQDERDANTSLTRSAAKSCAGANGVFFLPYLLGEQGTIWDPMAKGAFIGLNAATRYNDLCRAVLESIAYSLSQMLKVYRENGVNPRGFTICGGGANNSLLREIIATTLGTSVRLHANPSQVSALGAAICAAVGVGKFKSLEEAAKAMTRISHTVLPNAANHELYARMACLTESAYPALKGIMHQLDGFEHQVMKR